MIMIENFAERGWSWTRISQNPNLDIAYVLCHLEKPWDWDLLFYSLHWSELKRLRNVPGIPWDWNKMSFNPHIRLQEVLENSDCPWNWSAVSKNLVVNEQDIRQANIVWDWNSLSDNPSLTVALVVNLGQKPWNYEGLSRNPFRQT
jgi:hypothetical protein